MMVASVGRQGVEAVAVPVPRAACGARKRENSSQRREASASAQQRSKRFLLHSIGLGGEVSRQL